MTSFCQWTLVWSVQMQSLLSSCILHISADNRHPSASSCQHNTDSTFLTGRGEKLWQAPFPHSFIRLHIRQTANHSLTLYVDSYLTPIFRFTCWYPVPEADQTKNISRMTLYHCVYLSQMKYDQYRTLM